MANVDLCYAVVCYAQHELARNMKVVNTGEKGQADHNTIAIATVKKGFFTIRIQLCGEFSLTLTEATIL